MMLDCFLWFFATIGFLTYSPGVLLMALVTYRANEPRIPGRFPRLLVAVLSGLLWPVIAVGSMVLETITLVQWWEE